MFSRILYSNAGDLTQMMQRPAHTTVPHLRMCRGRVLCRPFAIAALGLLCALGAGCGHRAEAPAQKPQASALPAAPIQFVDVSDQAGIHFIHNNGAFGAKLLPETMGSGCAFIDYDGDGYQDIVLINGRDWTDAEIAAFEKGTGRTMKADLPAHPPKRGGTCRLYHNNGNGTFTDVTAGSGLDIPMQGMGVAVGDYDNDGRPDIFITAVGRNYLFHNEGRGKFREVAREAGLAGSGWSTSAAWVDYDKDGKLDLFVCHYVDWTPATDIFNSLDGAHKAYTTPEAYVGQVSRLYHNEGNGRFKDVSAEAGILGGRTPGGQYRRYQGKSLGVTICDFNNDGWPDIVVANDTEPNYLFQNNGNGTFTEIGKEAGIALSEAGTARAAMGTDAGDIGHSGKEALLFGNFTNQMLGLYQNRGSGLFIDIAPSSEVGQASLLYLTFGCVFADLDNDGWLDILTANGHLDDDIHRVNQEVTYAERPLLFRNLGNGRFREEGLQCGPDFAKPVVARGLAYADYDLDGDLDVLMTTNGGPARLLRNDGGNRNHSIRLVLEGNPSNRSAIGAGVEAKVGAEVIRRTVRSGSSYCSQSELPVTIGLGNAARADDVTIHWPSGSVQHLGPVDAGRILYVSEGRGITRQQPYPHR
ncbi:MAG: CRTAC1 family protein [Chthonomonadales bacterium]